MVIASPGSTRLTDVGCIGVLERYLARKGLYYMSSESQWVRPNPVLDAPNNIVLRQRDTRQVVTWLRQNRPVWLQGHFGLGVRLIEALHASQEVVDGLDFASRRGLAQEHRAEARGLLVRICAHRIDVPGARVGFLELYSELDEFFFR